MCTGYPSWEDLLSNVRLILFACVASASALASALGWTGAMLSSSDSTAMVSGVAGAGFSAGVVGGVVPVCGRASVVVWGAELGAVRGDGFVVDVVLSDDIEWFGVGGMMGMNVRL